MPIAPLTAVPAARTEEERARREAAERAALARLGQAEQPQELEFAAQDPIGGVPHEEDERARQGDDLRVQVEAERRIREVEEMHAEHRAPANSEVEEEALARELVETEHRLAENQQRTEEALERAAERLEQIESRATEAERRAERAEQLAMVKAEEIERAERLREMLDRIANAERRATEAELRARAAVKRVSAPVPEVDPDAIFDRHAAEQAGASPITEPPAAEAPDSSPSPEAPAPQDPTPGAEQGSAPGSAPVDLNSASYEQLRGLGLSVTQTGRLLAHRERVGGFSSADELNGIPGFPRGSLDALKGRVRI